MEQETIAAVATPVGRGGIGIIKISGRNALSIAEAVFQKTGNTPVGSRTTGVSLFGALQSHRLYHGHIVDPASGRI